MLRHVLKNNIISTICVLFFVFLAVGSSDNNQGTSTSSSVSKPDPKREILPLIRLDFKWGKGGFENVMLADFTIDNQSDKDIKDITVTCTHTAKSGTKIDDNTRTIYDVVKAHSKKRFKQFNMGLIHSQAASSYCRITNIELY